MTKRSTRFPAGTCLLLWAALAVLSPPAARADFKQQHIVARPMALGSAYVALADDANAVYWNPAGLTRLATPMIMGTRTRLFTSDINNDYVAVGVPGRLLSFGASWVRLGIDNIYSEDTINLAVAAKAPWLKGLSVGIAGKLFLLDAPGYVQYDDPNYLGGDHDFSFDLGWLYDKGGNWTLGGTFYNVLSPKLQLISTTTDPDPVYSEWVLGGSYLFRETLLATADLRSREGELNNMVINWGAEIWFFNTLALRAGMAEGKVTLGAGLQDAHWRLGLALETNNKLGDIYEISFTLRK